MINRPPTTYGYSHNECISPVGNPSRRNLCGNPRTLLFELVGWTDGRGRSCLSFSVTLPGNFILCIFELYRERDLLLWIACDCVSHIIWPTKHIQNRSGQSIYDENLSEHLLGLGRQHANWLSTSSFLSRAYEIPTRVCGARFLGVYIMSSWMIRICSLDLCLSGMC